MEIPQIFFEEMLVELKKEELVSKIGRIINVIETGKDLPLTIKEVLAFGSLLYGKKNPDDADLLMIYEPLTAQQEVEQLRAMEGYGTTLMQKMNGRLKSNREKVHIQYGASLEMWKQPYNPVLLRVWSKDDRDRRRKLQLSQDDINRILLNENERLRILVDWYSNTVDLYDLALEKLIENAHLGRDDAEKAKQQAEVLLKEKRVSRSFPWMADLRSQK